VRRSLVGLSSLTLATGLVAGFSAPGSAAPVDTSAATGSAPAAKGATNRFTGSDELKNPLESKRRALKQTGLTDVLKGRAKTQKINGSTVVKVGSAPTALDGSKLSAKSAASADGTGAGTGRDQYVELGREGTDEILTVLAEFGNKRHPDFPDRDTDPDTPGPKTFDGPKHNSIPKPDADDNSTVWQADFNNTHYRNVYFGSGEESLKSYYERQSSGRYSVEGQVAGWVTVPYNEARYGRSGDYADKDPNVCASNVCSNSQALVTDAIDALVARYKAQGMTTAQIRTQMQRFDVQDRYDYDGDGDFNEPDGYIDHFQVVHAGGDESDGDPQQGEDALWAHRWYVNGAGFGSTGPAGNKLGGTPVGDTGLFIGDYTMQPENGGVSVFTHEFGHDLGLPDHYDTAGGDNGVEFWNLMAQSRLNGAGEPLGTRAGDLSAWDKLQLGWLNYKTVKAGQVRTVDLGPHEYNTTKPQAIVDVLPDKKVTTNLGAPFSGKKQYFSGNADNLNTSLSLPVDLTGKKEGVFKLRGRYEIEAGYDYLYAQSSTDGGKTWTTLNGTIDGKPFGKDGGGQPAIDGSSKGKWVKIRVPLPNLVGKKGLVRLNYRTDGGFSAGGFFGDDLAIVADGKVVLLDTVEGTPKAALNGFSVVGSSVTNAFDNFYIASNRSWVSYDKYLKTGPYNFGWATTRPDHVEHFSYQQGLLVSYWDTSQADNNTSTHPGQGLILPVDAHPTARLRLDGKPWRSRVQVFDAPFGLMQGKSFTLHYEGQANNILGLPAKETFNDSRSYWSKEIPLSSVQVPHAGVKMQVTKQNGTSMTVQISKPAS